MSEAKLSRLETWEGLYMKAAAERDALRATQAELVKALDMATATVELFTGNGAQTQPKDWPRAANGEDVDYELVAKHCRAALARVKGAA